MDDLSPEFVDYWHNYDKWKYIDDFRKKILSVVIFFSLVFALGVIFTAPIVGFFVKLMKMESVAVTSTSPFQFIDLSMNVGLALGLFFSLPVILYHFYDFLKDGLKRREKKLFFLCLPISFILFLIGFFYGFTVLYYALEVIASLNVRLGIINLWDINKFLSQIVITSALLGLIFEFPIFLSFLISAGFLDRKFLKEKRRHAYILILIFVALLPPTDGFSMIIMSAPLIIIYEATIIFNYFLRNKVK